MSNIVLNRHDLELYLRGDLDVFAVPAEQIKDLSSGELGVLESHYRLNAIICKVREPNNPVEISGVRYTYDNEIVWNLGDGVCDHGELIPKIFEKQVVLERTQSQYPRAARTMPEYAIRHFLRVESVVQKPLRSFTKDDIRAMRLDYASTGDQQLLMRGYEDIKDYEMLYAWWKARYKSTLKASDNPLAIILRIASPSNF